MTEVTQLLVSGLATGAIYGLVGVGFIMIHNVTGIINFAQGEYVMLGAMAAVALALAGIPMPVVFALATAAVALAAAAIERATIAPARHASPLKLVIVTIGVSITLRGLALLIWGVEPRRYGAFSPGPPFALLGLSLNRQSLWILAFALLAAIVLWVFFTRTVVGKAMRACAMNPRAARLQGISPDRMSLASFAIAAGLAGAAGVVVVPITTASYDMGLSLGLNGFTAAVLGGLVSPLAAIAAGLVIGATESLAAGLISSSLKDAVTFALLLAVLVFRRQGVLSGGRRSWGFPS
jgi:branched-chain amino acid transport system permease protein